MDIVGEVLWDPHMNGKWVRQLFKRVDAFLESITEASAAGLIVAEIAVLFSSAISRYVFRSPLIWADEIAGVLFLWLAMLGAVIAFRRNSHMRMTALIDMFPEGARKALDFIAIILPAMFLLSVIKPAFDFARAESVVELPTLGISSAWRAWALPVGIGLMIESALATVMTTAKLKSALGPSVLIGAILCLAAIAHSTLYALGNLNLIIFFVGILGVLVFGGVPIGFSFGLATLSYLALTTNTPAILIVERWSEGASHTILLAIPLFVVLGLVMELTTMARAMVSFLSSLLGHVRGGLSYALIGAMYLVSGISGSKAADMAAIAPALVPEMRRRGIADGEIVALLAATGAQTETIPPSIVLVTIGSVAGVSISSLFKGGMLPALVLALILGIVATVRSPARGLVSERPANRREIGRAFVIAFPALLLPFLIRTAVVKGIATATEVSTLAIVYSLLSGHFVYRQLNWRRLWIALVEAAAMSGTILFIMGTATGVAWALTQSGFSHQLARLISALPGGPITFLGVSATAFLVLGSILEGIPAVVLFCPLLFPLARQFGINEIQYAMVVVLSMGVGLFAPPFGVGYYATCAIARVTPGAGGRAIVWYLLALIVGIVLIAAVPWLSTALLGEV